MTKGLSGNQLKILALVCMTVDHVGLFLFPSCTLLRVIGRVAFPVFAYMIAEGFVHTRSRQRYFLTMSVAALLCQIVYYAAMGSLKQCIFVTFALSLLLCMAVDRLVRHLSFANVALCAVAFAAVFAVCELVPLVLDGFSVEYGFVGALLPVLVFIAPSKPQKLTLLGVGVACLALTTPTWPVQWFALLSLVPLAFYNGTRGKYPMKYLFYVYYPLHLVVIYGLSLWL